MPVRVANRLRSSITTLKKSFSRGSTSIALRRLIGFSPFALPRDFNRNASIILGTLPVKITDATISGKENQSAVCLSKIAVKMIHGYLPIIAYSAVFTSGRQNIAIWNDLNKRG